MSTNAGHSLQQGSQIISEVIGSLKAQCCLLHRDRWAHHEVQNSPLLSREKLNVWTGNGDGIQVSLL